ncbi:hypothetical protein K402DRAFT_311430, partial [Aulographum hederae CBS 113979]
KSADDVSEKKSSLFSRSNKEKSSGGNPYAQTSSPDPYAQPAPPAYNGGSNNDSFRQDKTPVPVGGYGGSARFGTSGAYANQNGYGASTPYGDERGQESAERRPGGYGGMGGMARSRSDDTGRQALFGDAPQKYQQQQQQQQQQQSQLPPEERNGGEGGYGASSSGGYGESQGYGAYADRQLTEEEQEEEDVQASKQEIRFIKQQDVSSTRNALRLADQAYQTGSSTLERLGQQGERIHNTERNLDLASVQNRVATEKAKELKTLNRSMFAVHTSNPFTAKSRREERDMKIMDTHRRERDERDRTRAEAYQSHARQGQFSRELRDNPEAPRTTNRANLAERSKYQFEADSEDEAMENEIDDNLDALHGAAGKLKGLARAMGSEVDTQNKHIERITNKTDKVDDEIAMNRARLDRI